MTFWQTLALTLTCTGFVAMVAAVIFLEVATGYEDYRKMTMHTDRAISILIAGALCEVIATVLFCIS